MKKLGMLFIGFVLAMVLGACSGDELDGVEDTHNAFRDAVGGPEVQEDIEEVQNLLTEYGMQQISKEEFDERKEEILVRMGEIKDNLDGIDKPKGDKAKEYYELSYDMTSKSIDGIIDVLDVPEDIEDEDKMLEYQERVEKGQEEEMKAIEKVEDMREELEEEEGIEFEDE